MIIIAGLSVLTWIAYLAACLVLVKMTGQSVSLLHLAAAVRAFRQRDNQIENVTDDAGNLSSSTDVEQ
jgi:hypothetical protein